MRGDEIDDIEKHKITKDMKEQYPRSYAFLEEQGSW